MYDKSDNSKGKIYILENWNDSTKHFDKITTFMDGLRNPNQVDFYIRENKAYIFIAETHQLSYYLYNNGDNKPSALPKW
jgi:hypothetical protein